MVEIEIQEDSEEIPELKKGNKYCLECYGPIQEQFKLTLEDVADISSQLVDYHIDKLVDNGQLIKVDTMYAAQAIFSNKKI